MLLHSEITVVLLPPPPPTSSILRQHLSLDKEAPSSSTKTPSLTALLPALPLPGLLVYPSSPGFLKLIEVEKVMTQIQLSRFSLRSFLNWFAMSKLPCFTNEFLLKV
ncbi:hypothetical protein AAHE18_07G010000 [Arachis hypogaea]